MLSNRHLTDSQLASNLFIQPAAGDNGLSLGAALFVNKKRVNYPTTNAAYQNGRFSPYLGRAFTQPYVLDYLNKEEGIKYMVHRDCTSVAVDCLMNGNLIGFFHGKNYFQK